LPLPIASSLLPVADSDIVPFEVLAFGGTMLVIIVLIHGAGLDQIVARYKRRSASLRRHNRHQSLAIFVFATTVLLMLFLHITETCIWGVVLNKAGLIPNLRNSIYFSANTYTTIGYGSMILPYSWRELSPIMAISGLFTFAWTTGELFNVVKSQRDLIADLSLQRRRTRAHRSEPPHEE
jgi:hypothetical protein